MKLGLSAGNVEWGIVGNESKKVSEEHKAYFFKGEAINGCAYSEHQCEKMEIIIDEKLLNQTPEKQLKVSLKAEVNGVKYYTLSKLLIEDNSISQYSHKELSEETLLKFFPSNVVNLVRKGEFRDIVSVFISFKETQDFDELNLICEEVIEQSDLFGGYFNSLDFGDKGGTILVLFGMPILYENNIFRALNFAYKLKEKLWDKVRFGVVSGIVFAGLVGTEERGTYSALGDTVNQSARFMMKANWGSVWISKIISKKASKLYEIENIGKISFKGKSKPIEVYELKNRRQKIEQKIFEGDFVGRDSELKSLKDLCEPIFKRKFAGLSYVFGEAGIGKSRLLYELSKTLEYKSNIFIIKCDSISKTSFHPFINFFEDYFELSKYSSREEKKRAFDKKIDDITYNLSNLSDDNIKSDIRKLLDHSKSVIASMTGIFDKDNSVFEKVEDKDIPQLISFAIKDFFKAQALISPVILQIEDIQWIDKDSEEAIRFITRNVRKYPIAIFALGRFNDDGTPPILDIDDEVIKEEVLLGRLTLKESKELVETKISASVTDKLIKSLDERAQGNPFFIDQIYSYFLENNLVELNGKYYQLKEEAGESFIIPNEISSIIMSRIDRLSEELKETIQMASVIGREFDTKVLREMLNILIDMLSIMDLDEGLKTFLSNIQTDIVNNVLFEGEIERLWSNFSEVKYIFKHAILVDVAYDMQLKQRLMNFHRIVAEAIMKVYPKVKSKYGEIAYHLEKAELYPKAMEFYEKAGDHAISLFQNDQAHSYYVKALNIATKQLNDNKEIANFYVKLGEANTNDAKYDNAITLIEKALEIQKEIYGEQNIDTARTYNRLGETYGFYGDYDKSIELYEKALSIRNALSKKGEEEDALIYNNLGVTYWDKGEFDKAMSYYDKSLEIRYKIYDNIHIETALTENDKGMLYWEKGEFEKSMSQFDIALDMLIKSAGEKNAYTALVYHNIAMTYWRKGEYDKTVEYVDKALKIYHEVLGSHHTLIAENYNTLGVVYLKQSKFDDAIENINKAIVIFKEALGERHADVTTLENNLAMVYDSKGDYDKALELLRKTLDIRLDIFGEKHHFTSYSYSNMGKVCFNIGDIDKAIDYLKKSLSIRQELGDNGNLGYDYTYLASAYALKGDADKAIDYAVKHFDNIKEVGVDVENGRSYLASALALSIFDDANHLLSLLSGNISDVNIRSVDSLYKLAIDTSKEVEYYPTLIPSLYEYGKYIYDSDKTEGSKLIYEARDIATKIGMKGELDKVNRIISELGL